jgi:hypothetical protein
MSVTSPGRHINCHVISSAAGQSLCADRQTDRQTDVQAWRNKLALLRQVFVADALIIGKCFLFLNPLHFRAHVAVLWPLWPLQDSCTVRSAAVRHIRDISGSNVSPATGASDRFLWLSSVPPGRCWGNTVLESRPRPLPFTSFLTFYSLLNPSYIFFCTVKVTPLRNSFFTSAKFLFLPRHLYFIARLPHTFYMLCPPPTVSHYAVS